MAETAAAPTRDGELGTVVRGLLLIRLSCIALSVPAVLLGGGNQALAGTYLVVVLFGSLTPLLLWDRAERFVVRHPLFLGLDLLLATGLLLLAGPAAPFVLATLATALLGGLLYGWVGATLSALLFATVYLIVAVETLDAGDPASLALVFVVVCLYPLLGGAGARLRALLRALRAARQAEARALRDAADAEARLRLARDLHDSVGKTLHGIELQAHALRLAELDGVTDELSAIEHGARTAAKEARELIEELREPARAALDTDLGRLTSRWSAATGCLAILEVEDHDPLPAAVRREITAIVGEALENVYRHAQATSVSVRVHQEDQSLVVIVSDNGVGFPPDRPSQAVSERHYGLVGMRERATLIDGALDISSRPGEGTTVHVSIPRAVSSTHAGGAT